MNERNNIDGLTRFMRFLMLIKKCYFENAGISEAVHRYLEPEDPFMDPDTNLCDNKLDTNT